MLKIKPRSAIGKENALLAVLLLQPLRILLWPMYPPSLSSPTPRSQIWPIQAQFRARLNNPPSPSWPHTTTPPGIQQTVLEVWALRNVSRIFGGDEGVKEY